MPITEQRYGGQLTPEQVELQKPGISFGEYFPELKLTPAEIASWNLSSMKGQRLDETAIRNLIGDKDRSIASDGEDTVSMGIASTQLSIQRDHHLDFFYFSTSFPRAESERRPEIGVDFSDKVANWLFLDTPRENRINVHTACAGAVEALLDLYKKDTKGGKPGGLDGARIGITASEMYQGGNYMVGASDPRDRAKSKTIFGDGSKSMIATLGRDLVIEYADNFTDFTPEEHAAIRMPIDYTLVRGEDEGRAIVGYVPGNPEEKIYQDGQALLLVMPERIKEFVGTMLGRAKIDPREIDGVIPHPGSNTMTMKASRHLSRMGLGNILSYPLNISSGSILDSFDKHVESGRIRRNNRLLLLGFGGGLRITGAIVKLGGRD